jgi:hypothetical protein
VPKAQAYDVTMYVLAGLMVLGFLCNLMVRPIADKHFMTDAELPTRKKLAHERDAPFRHRRRRGRRRHGGGAAVTRRSRWRAGAGPGAVGIPLLIGMWITLQKAVVLFK